MKRTNILVGVEYGRQHGPSAICVAQEKPEYRNERRVLHYVVRFLERLPIGTTMPALATRLAEVVRTAREMPTVQHSAVIVNATGGQPLLDCLGLEMREPLWAVYFNHGDKRTREGRTITLGKAYLVTRLQMLLQSERLQLPGTAEARVLAEELLAYEVKVGEDAESRYGSFSIGARDDLVMALGLAVQYDHSIRVPQIY